jgi:hypothetical protein
MCLLHSLNKCDVAVKCATEEMAAAEAHAEAAGWNESTIGRWQRACEALDIAQANRNGVLGAYLTEMGYENEMVQDGPGAEA